MTEQDYINVRDLSNVLHGYNCLADITIANQPNIPKAEYQHVMRKISEWKDKMFDVCRTEAKR